MQTLQDLINSFEDLGDRTAVSWKDDRLRSISFSELYNLVIGYSRGFLELGLEKGDKVAIISGNIPQWLALTLGINNAGLVDVPRGDDSTAEEIKHILSHSKAKAVIVENNMLFDKVEQCRPPNLEHIISIGDIEGAVSADSIFKLGNKSYIHIPVLSPDDTASIIYTSGTTGVPKGVELTHGNFTSNINGILKRLIICPDDKLISILPAWHAFERMAKYIAAGVGVETFYSTKKTLVKDFQEQRPTIMVSVPRIWELFYNRIIENVDESGRLKKALFNHAVDAAISYAENPGLLRKIPYDVYNITVLSRLRKLLGDKFRLAISGGGALPNHIDQFFNAIGIELLEGYGLTETAPVVSVRVPGERSIGTVGKPLDSVEVKIVDPETGQEAEKGIICVKGLNVMKGYYLDDEATIAVFKQGWLNTGDLGYFKNGNLVIAGRLKDIIVLSNGENINPSPIEEVLTRSSYIETAVVVGQDWKALGVLLVPNVDALHKYCSQQ